MCVFVLHSSLLYSTLFVILFIYVRLNVASLCVCSFSALHHCAANGYSDLVKEIVEYGGIVMVGDNKGESMLHCQCQHASTNVCACVRLHLFLCVYNLVACFNAHQVVRRRINHVPSWHWWVQWRLWSTFPIHMREPLRCVWWLKKPAGQGLLCHTYMYIRTLVPGLPLPTSHSPSDHYPLATAPLIVLKLHRW